MFVMALLATGHSRSRSCREKEQPSGKDRLVGKGPRRDPRTLPSPAAGWWGSPSFLGAPVPLGKAGVGAEAGAEADLGVFFADLGRAARAEPRLGLAGEMGESGLDVTEQE